MNPLPIQLNPKGEYMRSDPNDFRAIKVRKIFNQIKDSKILDVCCADGALLRPFTRQNQIYGIDYSPNIAEAEGYKEVKNANLEHESLPYAADFFDVVFAGECIEHIANTQHVLKEINRVLKKGGLFVLTTPNCRTIQTLILLALFNLPSPAAAHYKSAHVRDWTTKLLHRVLEEHHFEVQSMIGTDLTGWLPKIGAFKTCSGLATHIPSLSSQVIVTCKKS